jgi:plastocyanin
MSEHEEMKPNRPAVAVLCIAGLLLAISITSVLLIPGLQPRYVAAPAPGGPSGPSPGGGGPPPPAGAQSVIIAPSGAGISEINFEPANIVLVIGVNNTLVLKNEDTADHTITSNPGDAFSFDTGDVSGLSSSNPIVFSTPGVFAYHCQFHPAYMHGTITVVSSAASSGSATVSNSTATT